MPTPAAPQAVPCRTPKVTPAYQHRLLQPEFRGRPERAALIEQLKFWCLACPLLQPCLRDAIREVQPETISETVTAGLTARQLRIMRCGLGLPPAPQWGVAQIVDQGDLEALAEHRARFAPAWEALDSRDITDWWLAASSTITQAEARDRCERRAAGRPTQTQELAGAGGPVPPAGRSQVTQLPRRTTTTRQRRRRTAAVA